MSISIDLNRTPLSTSLVGPMINDLTLCRRQKLDIVVPVRPVKFYGYSFPISFVFGVIPYSFGTVHWITITETNCRPPTRCHALKQKRCTVWVYYRHESSIKTPHAVQRLAWLLLSLVSPTWRTSGGCWVIVTSVHTLYSRPRIGRCVLGTRHRRMQQRCKGSHY